VYNKAMLVSAGTHVLNGQERLKMGFKNGAREELKKQR